MPYFIHKHEVSLQYGGPEEGGWWFDAGTPVETFVPEGPFTDEEHAYERCRELNTDEGDRAKREEDYDYTSVLSYKSQHFSYSVHESTVMKPYPERRPFYE